MADYACIIQEGQAAQQKQEALARGLRGIGEEAFGDDSSETKISWIVVKKGFGWTAGEPSRASLVIRSVPVGLAVDRREAFMHQVCDLWKAETGCSTNDIVVTAFDGPLPL